MTATDLLTRIDESAAALRARFGTLPDTLVIAGSGLGSFAKRARNATTVGYGDLPHFPVSTVVGHAGTLVVGEVGGRRTCVMNGRKHLYEGVDVNVSVHPLRALLRAGVTTVIVSNAAGGLNPAFDVGDLCLLSDHFNGMFRNPLIGPNLEAMGPRFPDMTQAYDPALIVGARRAGNALGVKLKSGVYAALSGPAYETPAEIGMLRAMGADLCGMSTVPETIVARHMGARVLGISCVTNLAAGIGGEALSHAEVTEVANRVKSTFVALLDRIVADLGAEGTP